MSAADTCVGRLGFAHQPVVCSRCDELGVTVLSELVGDVGMHGVLLKTCSARNCSLVALADTHIRADHGSQHGIEYAHRSVFRPQAE
jgi:hypothetical protein